MAINFDKAQLLREALSILDGGQEKGALTVYNGDPNGNVTGTVGALCIDYSGSGKLWKNSNGSSTWVEVGGGGGGGHIIEDEGTPVAQEPVLDIRGIGVDVTPETGKTAVIVNDKHIISKTKQLIEEDYTVETGFNGASVGPVSVDVGVTVTIDPGSVWAIL